MLNSDSDKRSLMNLYIARRWSRNAANVKRFRLNGLEKHVYVEGRKACCRVNFCNCSCERLFGLRGSEDGGRVVYEP